MARVRSRDLAKENEICLCLIQAMLGLISSRMRGVAIEIQQYAITVHFAVTQIDEHSRQQIDAIMDDFAAFMYPAPFDTQAQVFAGDADELWPGFEQRQLFRAAPDWCE